MTANKFAAELAKFAPDIPAMKAKGYPEGAIQAELRGFILQEKEGVKAIQDNPLLDLLTRFDCTLFILGNISFQQPDYENGRAYIAALDGSFLVLNATNEIEEIEHEDDNYIQTVAETPVQFLKILLVYAKYLHDQAANIPYSKESFINKCRRINASGTGFYRKLFGA